MPLIHFLQTPRLWTLFFAAGLVFPARNAPAQEITADPGIVTEADAAAVSAGFRYRFPAAAPARTFEFAVLAGNLQPGADFTPFRETRTAGAGAAFEGVIPLQVLPDLLAEENGSLSLVVRGPESADWAASMSAPEETSRSVLGSGANRVIYWGEDFVVSAAYNQNQTGSILRIHERAASGDFIQRFQYSSASLYAFSAEANSRTVLMPGADGLKTWIRVGNSFVWQATDKLLNEGVSLLSSDRLVASGTGAVFRLDPASPTGWRRTGQTENAVAAAEDFLVVRKFSKSTVCERSEGTEDQWQPAYSSLPESAQPILAVAPGMLAMFGPAGLEIHERLPAGWTKAGTVPVFPNTGGQTSVALSGDWIAVGLPQPYATPPAPEGTVRLFLRSTSDRSLWNDVGTLTGPGADYGQRLSWNGPELISLPDPNSPAGNVVVRRFKGATIKVLDDDRNRPQWLTVPLREPVSGSVVRSILAELPLAAASDISFDYEVLDGTAVSGNGGDFLAESGKVTIPAGSARAPVPITVLADSKLEASEYFTLRLLRAGQPPVSAQVEIRESSPPAVLTASASPLIEGYGESTVTLHQTASTGSVLPVGPATIQIRTGGFEDPPANSQLTTRDVDLSSLKVTKELSATAPEASFEVAATQDSVQEWDTNSPYTQTDERVRTAFTGLGTAREAGTFGWAFDGEVPPLPAAQGVFPEFQSWTMGGNWFFGEWAKRDVQPGTSTGVLAVHRLTPDDTHLPPAVQFIPWEGINFSASLFCDGETLVVCMIRADEDFGPTSHLRIFEPSGPPDSPWRLISEQKRPANFTATTRMLRPDRILWEGQLLEKTGGLWKWRFADFGSSGTILDADGDWMLQRGQSQAGSVTAYRRAQPYQPDWTLVREFIKSQDQQATSIYDGRVRGRTLTLIDGLGRLEVLRESAGGSWQFEQSIPKEENSPAMLLAGESTLVLKQGIYSRTGPPSLPWIQTGVAPDPWNYQENSGPADSSPLSAVDPLVFGSSPRLRIMRAGMPLTVYDDDALQFSITTSNNLSPYGEENYFSESVTTLALRATRAAPLPMTVRVRSQDNGSAISGLDYVPLDLRVPVSTSGQGGTMTLFPFRILADRIPEGYETLNLVMDPPLFGSVAAPTEMNLMDSYRTTLKAAATTTILFEPLEGNAIQGVAFLSEVAFDRDVEFLVTVEAGGSATTGTDFTLPAGKVILKAGENRLWVPVSVNSDASDEADEQFVLRVTSDPALPRLYATAKVLITDAEFPGLAGDSYSGGTQGAALIADGQDGHPAGLRANDPAAPAGGYQLSGPPLWGTVTVNPDGSFTALPGPNVTGPVWFTAQAETIPFTRFLDASGVWKYLHPLTGISPAVANPDFPATWNTGAFDDSAWTSAAGTLTYGGFPIPVPTDIVILTTPPEGKRYTDYFRTSFQSPVAVTVPLTIQLYCDDGVVIYINGMERGRAVTTTSTTFTSAADTYTMVTGGSQTELQEVTLKTVVLGDVPLLAGENLLAVSLHNVSNASSDLGLRLMSLETGVISSALPVMIYFADAATPSVGAEDVYDCPQNAVFLSSDHFGAGFLDNDGLISPTGQAYDPVLEITASSVSAGTLTLVGSSGHFSYSPPDDFSGTATFTYQIRDKDGLSAPVQVTLNVKPMRPFDIWKQEALSAQAQGSEDADGDGMNNFLEYVLGSDPADAGTDGGHGFVTDSGSGLRIMIRRASDLAWKLEAAASPDALNWQMIVEARGLNYQSPLPADIVISDVTADSQMLRITPPPATFPRRFYRLRTLRIPPQ